MLYVEIQAMSQEVISPSDDEIFISTQIQGKLDELDEEAKAKSLAISLRQYANQAVVTAPGVPTKKTKSAPKPKPKAKVKRKSKKLSVTDQMIKKLSGKPQKLKQMRLKDNVQRAEIVSVTPSFEDSSQNNYDAVFNSKEWTKLKYVLNVNRSHSFAGKENAKNFHKEGLWDAAGDTPEFDMNDWNELYGYQDRCKVSRMEADSVPPITFSQVYKSSPKAIEVYEDKDVQDCCEVEEVTIEDLNISYGDEVVCSSDEGSIIEVMSGHIGSSDLPIVLSSQSSEDAENISPAFKTGEVKYKGSNLKINQDSRHLTTVRARKKSEIEIPGSSDDEDDVSYYIGIVRQECCDFLDSPSSSGYDCDDEFE